MSKTKVVKNIERLRKKLYADIDNCKSLTDANIVETSVLLDDELNSYYKLLKKGVLKKYINIL